MEAGKAGIVPGLCHLWRCCQRQTRGCLSSHVQLALNAFLLHALDLRHLCLCAGDCTCENTAEAAYKRVMALEPDNPDALLGLATIRMGPQYNNRGVRQFDLAHVTTAASKLYGPVVLQNDLDFGCSR